MMKKLNMNDKILLMTFFIIAFTLMIAGTFIIGNLLQEQENYYGQRGMLIARTVSNSSEIASALTLENQDQAIKEINEYVEEVRVINKAAYIVVMNMDRIKYSHPVTSELGTVSTSQDINAAFNEHYYTSKAKGTSGTMIRAFVPVLNAERKQIGVVIVGYPAPTLKGIVKDYKSEIFLLLVLAILFSIWGAYSLARHIKKQMFGLEPEEISRMYVERLETFNAMHEGVIAVDNNLKITIFNAKAGEILGVTGDPQSHLQKNIKEVLPDTRLPEIVESRKPKYNQELFVNNRSILSNRIPITVNGKNAGAVAIFKDLTEVKQLAEELTGVKAFVQALRVQTHEHKNKLHTITGLLQLGHTKQAIEYLTSVRESEDSLAKFLNERFSNENISGLLLSKILRGKELDIRVEIDEESQLSMFPPFLDHHDFVILFGNLIENAFDALNEVSRQDKLITISVDEHDGFLAILVSDNGIGMSEDVQQKIFENGFSTKEGEYRGIGLYLISEIVQKGNGTIEVTSEEGNGTTFVILFELGDETA